jgi:anti-sigma-K factor RskA
MRYDEGQLLDALAREYVVGTLSGRARARFGRVLSSSLVARRAVLAWERDLAPLARAVKPVEPPPEAFERIETALGCVPRGRRRARWNPGPRSRVSRSSRYCSAGSTSGSGRRPSNTYVAVVNDASTPVWLIRHVEARAIKTRTINPRPAPPTTLRALMPQDGANPVSPGVIAGAGATDNPPATHSSRCSCKP